MVERTTVHRRLARTAVASSLVVFAASCGVSTGSAPMGFQVIRSKFSVAASTPIAISGRHLAFLADEATTGPGGTDMNGDGDKTDSIAVMVDMNARVETRLDVAASEIAWIGGELYLVVDEALDGRDWNGDADTDDTVLLHVSSATPTHAPDFVDVLSTAGATRLVSVGTNLFYSSATAPTHAGESDLFAISASAPTTPVAVLTQDPLGPLSPRILAKDEGLLFLALDETVEGRDLNGDGDATDTSVLALLDGTGIANAIRNVGLAMPAGSPLRARKSAAHDWDVGFLVSERAQGATNLNDPALFTGAWQPSQCAGAEDADASDSILHFLKFAAWDADPVASPPVNTGLVGCRKIAIANDYIATITPEHDAADPNGAEGDCDLNGDGDKLDYVVRWVQMTTPVLPLTPAANLHALTNVPGGTHGLSELGSRFVIEVSEAQDDLDINGDGQKTFDYVGWLSPSGAGATSTPWQFQHGANFTTLLGASWMTEMPDRAHLGLALQEKSFGPLGAPGLNINAHDPPLPGEDLDMLDSVPTFPVITGTTPYLAFPGVSVAVKNDNAGIVVVRDLAFYRVSESEDSRDWNGDGLETGYILFRTSLTHGWSAAMGVSNVLPGRPAIEVNAEEATPTGAAYIADEHYLTAAGTDLNGDGDATDLVISYFTF